MTRRSIFMTFIRGPTIESFICHGANRREFVLLFPPIFIAIQYFTRIYIFHTVLSAFDITYGFDRRMKIWIFYSTNLVIRHHASFAFGSVIMPVKGNAKLVEREVPDIDAQIEKRRRKKDTIVGSIVAGTRRDAVFNHWLVTRPMAAWCSWPTAEPRHAERVN